MGAIGQDLAYGVRQIRRSPWVSAVAAISLALGIGATTTVFTMLDALLWKELPVPAPNGLVKIQTVDTRSGRLQGVPPSMLRGLNDRSDVFTGVLAGINDGISFRAGDLTERVMAEAVTANYFEVLGVDPFIGRYFSPGGDSTAWRAEAVLSYDFFHRRFGRDPAIVGRTIHLNGYPFEVIGVSPKSFFGVEVGSSWEVRVPMILEVGMQARLYPALKLLDPRNDRFVSTLARLKPGVTREQAEVASDVLFQQLFAADPEIQSRQYAKTYLRIADGRRGYSPLAPHFERTLVIVMSLAGVLLLVACANVANLLLTRASVRQREISIRLAVGASRGRIVRQLLTESLLLASIGGALGFGFAYWGSDILIRFLPQGSIPIVITLELDTRVLAFAMTASVITAILFGLVPALQTSRADLAGSMKPQAGVYSFRRRLTFTSSSLIPAQVALALVLSIGAMLFVRSLDRLQADLGYLPERLIMLSMKPVRDGNVRYTDAQLRRLYTEALRRVEELPGVEGASMTAGSLGTLNRNAPLVSIQKDDEASATVELRNDEVSPGPGFLSTMGLSLTRGRTFSSSDHDGPPVVIISDTLERDLFGQRGAVGRRIRFGDSPAAPPTEIIGVVHRARPDPYRAMGRLVFLPLGRGGLPSICTLLVRADTRRVNDLISAVRTQLRTLDKDLPVFNIRTASMEFDRVLARERLIAMLSSWFGSVAIFLVVIGLYGAISYSVARRVRDIGIRMALGAKPRGTPKTGQ